ncbi:MAG: T9SS type A sorting domain-containing protein [Candidatus Marinimicrobia bacterium]|nr:T9SS type A sorting domain-containing protein [Candidatus Neomarinimicrobiota bacterium]
MKKVTRILLFGLFLIAQVQADLFPRIDFVEIDDSQVTNNGGIGNFIAGVDVDEDGLIEIYMVNDNWNDGPGELVPRIYKYEKATNGDWDMVWSAIPPATLVDMQNTWPTLVLADLDADGKQELVWGIVNNTGTFSNPPRIVVYEHAGGDNFGVENAGAYDPNSTWSIASADGENIRPIDMEVLDFDGDGVDEIIFADRAGNNSGYYFGICSVDDIPDNGDGSETWTLESEGHDFGLTSSVENKWDVAVVGSNAYFFSETEITKISWTGSAYEYAGLSPLAGGSCVQSAMGVDVDEDGTTEIVGAIYDWGDDSMKGVYVMEEMGDTLMATQVANLAEYWPSGSRGPWGGAMGDIDNDGYIDFVYGSRASTPNSIIIRCSYLGGEITAPENWETTIIDSVYAVEDMASGGIWSLINIANMDEDDGLEVLYTSSSSVPYSLAFPTTNVSAPVIILDSPNHSVSIKELDVQIAKDYKLMQNYPNPFNPSTTITFNLPNNERVNMSVYDMTGKEVATLVNRSMSAGSYDLTWGGLDNNGVQVASGMYIYTLKTTSFTESKRMVLLK